MYLRYVALVVSLSLGCHTLASASELTKKEILKLQQSIAFEYQQGIKVCDTLNWNESDVCIAKASTKQDIDRAELHANTHPTAKTRYAALIAHANGNHEVAITKCNGIALEERNTCWNDAEHVKQGEIQKAKSLPK
ncbi:hypothetical protein [Methylophilus sp. OH31]|uniref:hypothetical protein n=1 Tax=Methylophilus sp. OH31 TaxID=1387312 RepID=UPI0004656A14|nr:hypothetical protein [Methylophilus sp. OH31]